MRNFLIILYLLLFNVSFATTYYVDSKNGNDSKDGTSPSTAWKTISKINTVSLGTGDSILFKRGNIFRGSLKTRSGSSAGSITYSAYGTGAKPLLLGSENKSQISDWVNEGSNIWRCSVSIPVDVGNMIFDYEASTGWKKWKKSDLINQGDYWWDNTGTQQLRIYSTSNPGSFYTNIEIALNQKLVDFSNTSYIIINNLDFRYNGGACVFGYNSNNIIIQDCDFSYIGGSSGFWNGRWVRFGNGVVFWKNAHDNIVERCTFDQMYDAAVTVQGDGTGSDYMVYNIYFRNNIINRSEYSYEFFARRVGTIAHDIYFENNTCTNAGGGWGHNQRPDGPNGAHLMLSYTDANVYNLYIRNNIFSNSTNYSIRWYDAADVGDFILDNNCYYEDSGDVARIYGTYYNYNTQWDNYRSASGQDTQSIATNPLLKSDFTLQENSPCVDAGLNVSTVLEDYNGESRPQGNN